mgnify:FL=1
MAEEETKDLTSEETTTEETEEKPSTEDETSEEDKDDNDEPDKDDKEEDKPDETSEEEDLSKVQDKEGAAEVLKSKGFDYSELAKEFDEKGEISKETRAKLAEVGAEVEVK